MAELDLIQQLDRTVDAMLAGSEKSASPEVTELMAVARMVRDLPDEDFRARLRSELSGAIRELERSKAMSTSATEPKPGSWLRAGFHSLTPYLHVSNAAAQIEFLKRVFGAEELGRYPAPDGKIMHAEVRIGDSMVEMGEPPEPKGMAIHIYVPDVDAAYQRALEAGAASLGEPADHEYGERGAGVRDAEGNFWYLATANGERYIAPGLQAVNLYLHPKGATSLIDFLQRAFGAEEVARHEAGGAVVHAQLRFGDSILEMGEAHGQYQPMPAAIHYYIPNVDQVFERAVAAGAKSVREPRNEPYGDRAAILEDPHGNQWYLAAHLPEAR